MYPIFANSPHAGLVVIFVLMGVIWRRFVYSCRYIDNLRL